MPSYNNPSSWIPFAFITNLDFHKNMGNVKGFKAGKSKVDLFFRAYKKPFVKQVNNLYNNFDFGLEVISEGSLADGTYGPDGTGRMGCDFYWENTCLNPYTCDMTVTEGTVINNICTFMRVACTGCLIPGDPTSTPPTPATNPCLDFVNEMCQKHDGCIIQPETFINCCTCDASKEVCNYTNNCDQIAAECIGCSATNNYAAPQCCRQYLNTDPNATPAEIAMGKALEACCISKCVALQERYFRMCNIQEEIITSQPCSHCQVDCIGYCSPECQAQTCFTEDGDEVCACKDGRPNTDCHCLPQECGGLPGTVCCPPEICPCTQSLIWPCEPDYICPSICCDPSIAGCVECCPIDEPGCGIYIPEDLCCQQCEPCETAGGAVIPREQCEQFICAWCASNPTYPGCGNCGVCPNGTWVPIGTPCDAGCNHCQHPPEPCENCVYCGVQSLYVPIGVVCIETPTCPNPLNPACWEGENPLCYSYSSNDPIYYSPNGLSPAVTVTYQGPGSEFAYGSIATLCEIPDEFQLCVFVTKVWSAGSPAEERQLTYTPTVTDPTSALQGFTLNILNAKINLYTPLLLGETMVVKRCSESSKMLFHFEDGAKLSSKDLNASLHQLLFLIQEKQFEAPVINQHYPLPTIALLWSIGGVYSAGTFVSYATTGGSLVIYKALVNIAAGQAVPGVNPNWQKIAYATNGFVLEGGQELSGPVIFSLQGINIGDALVWNGSKFTGVPMTAIDLNSLSDVIINPATLSINQVLQYKEVPGSGPRWVNAEFQFTGTFIPILEVDNLELNNWAFYDTDLTAKSFDNQNPRWLDWVTPLQSYKNSNGDWVIPNPPTIMNMVSNMFPDSDPNTFFDDVSSLLAATTAQVASPVLAKISWDVSKGMSLLSDPKAYFWSSPGELFNTSAAANVTNYISDSGWESAYQYNTGGSNIDKVWGYGLVYEGVFGSNPFRRGFYLNTPECKTTTVTTPSYEINGNIVVHTDNSTNTILPTEDLYLKNIRDLAFALSDASVTSPNPNSETIRIARSAQIKSEYSMDGLVSWRRMDLHESPVTANISFKVPKELVYYNQMAAILGANGFKDPVVMTEPKLSRGGSIRLKDESLTSRFQTASQIHWFLAGVTSSHTNQLPVSPLNSSLWPIFNSGNVWVYPPTGTSNAFPGTAADHNLTGALEVLNQPIIPADSPSLDGIKGTIGDLSLIIEANKLFSTSSSYMPEPFDKYVFDIILDPNVSLAIYPNNSSGLVPNEPSRSHVHIDWGLTDISLIRGAFSTARKEQMSMVKKENIKVYASQIQHFSTTSARFKLNVEIPRLKYIGYSNFFRRSGIADISDSTETLALWYANNFNTKSYDSTGNPASSSSPEAYPVLNASVGNIQGLFPDLEADAPNAKMIGLRNEVGVKFVRMGIPSNLWINISVLASKPQLGLIA